MLEVNYTGLRELYNGVLIQFESPYSYNTTKNIILAIRKAVIVFFNSDTNGSRISEDEITKYFESAGFKINGDWFEGLWNSSSGGYGTSIRIDLIRDGYYHRNIIVKHACVKMPIKSQLQTYSLKKASSGRFRYNNHSKGKKEKTLNREHKTKEYRKSMSSYKDYWYCNYRIDTIRDRLVKKDMMEEKRRA